MNISTSPRVKVNNVNKFKLTLNNTIQTDQNSPFIYLLRMYDSPYFVDYIQ